MDLWEVLSAAAVIVSLASFAGLGLQRGVVTSLREQLGDARDQIKDLKEKNSDNQKVMAEQAHAIATLQRTVTGEVQWTVISGILDDHHRSATEHWSQEIALLTEIKNGVKQRNGTSY